jgi:hypothetical protein
LGVREAEIANKQAPARHPLRKALQANEQRVEKSGAASRNKKNIHFVRCLQGEPD